MVENQKPQKSSGVPRNNDWVKKVAKVVGLVVAVLVLGGLITAPMQLQLSDCKRRIEKNADCNHEQDKVLVGFDRDLKHGKELLDELLDNQKRLMRDWGTPPVSDTPVGEHPADVNNEEVEGDVSSR